MLADATSAEAMLSLASLCGLGGYVLFAFGLPGNDGAPAGFAGDGDVRTPTAIVAAGLIGVCQIGTIICSLALLAKARRTYAFSPGPLAGAYSFVGGLGIVAVSTIGALTFDLYTPSPFIVLAVLAAITTLTAGIAARRPT